MINGPKFHEDTNNFTILNINNHLKELESNAVKGMFILYLRWYNKLDPALSKNN